MLLYLRISMYYYNKMNNNCCIFLLLLEKNALLSKGCIYEIPI